MKTEHHFVEANGVDYHIEVCGAGEPLVLLHGFTGACSNWHAHLPIFGKAFKVILVDLLGHGQTDAPDDPLRYAMHHAAADLQVIIEFTAHEPVHLLGYSMGGRLALYTALKHAAWVRTLTLVSASPGLDDAEARSERKNRDNLLADRIERDGVLPFVRYWEGIPLFATQERLPDDKRDALRRQRLNNRAHGLANSLRGMGTGVQPSLWDDLDRLRMPVTLVTGELDGKFVRIGNQMHARIPQAGHVILPDAGHTVQLEQPEAFQRVVLDFLR